MANAPDERSRVQQHKLRTYFLELYAPEPIRQAYVKRLAARRELEDFDADLPTTMVMQEMPTPRDTRLLIRGEHDKPGAKVRAGVPAPLPPIAAGLPNHRPRLACRLPSPA